MTKPQTLISPETWLALIFAALLLWGGFTIFSSGSISGDSASFGWRQIIWGASGLLFLLGAWQTDFDKLYRHAYLLAGIVLIPLVLVWFCGIKVNGMRGWYDLGGIFLQPSELSKPLYLLLLCRIAIDARDEPRCILYMIAAFTAFSLPLILQPDFGTLLVYVAITATVYWIYAGRLKWLIIGTLTFVPLLLGIVLSQSYVVRRFAGYFSPESDPLGAGWHTLQLRYAIANGGLTGKGASNAQWSNAYLPYSYCDSAFAAMVETIGGIGGMVTILMFFMTAVLCVYCSRKLNDPARAGFIIGGGLLILIQAFIHISVNVTLFPVTGLTCPLLSYGGSSLTGTLLLIGMIFSAMRKKPTATQS